MKIRLDKIAHASGATIFKIKYVDNGKHLT